jgi:hypothetical protein
MSKDESNRKYKELADEARAKVPPYPEDRFSGRGVIINGGGVKYFTCAWVCLNMLRRTGCELPVEVWHLGRGEMDEEMQELLKPLNASTRDAYTTARTYPVRRLFGWELKPYAMIHSSFQEVLFLDADNVTLVDPDFLFETEEYKKEGAIFWPDFGRLAKTRAIWDICGVPYRDEPEFETGQIVVDKKRCWEALQLTMHLNEHSDFYYKHIHGDKDTFHMAWHMVGQKYAMPSRGIHALRATMCQHDFDGRRIFQHRNMDKFRLSGGNAKIKGFEEEDECFRFVEDLKSRWKGVISMPIPKTEAGIKLRDKVIEDKDFTYVRVGYDKRQIELCENGVIGKGAAGMESSWYIDESDDKPRLCIAGGAPTCFLDLGDNDVWTGRWLSREQMPIELTPLRISAAQKLKGAKHRKHFEGKTFVYNRVGYDKRTLEFLPDGSIGEGARGQEKVWDVLDLNGHAVLQLGPAHGNPICELRLAGKAWKGRWNAFEKMEIELVPVSEVKAEKAEEPTVEVPEQEPPKENAIKELRDRMASQSARKREQLVQKYMYVRVGYDTKMLRFLPDGTILGGGKQEKFWNLGPQGRMKVGPEKDKSICELLRSKDGVWRGVWTDFEKMSVELIPVPISEEA